MARAGPMAIRCSNFDSGQSSVARRARRVNAARRHSGFSGASSRDGMGAVGQRRPWSCWGQYVPRLCGTVVPRMDAEALRVDQCRGLPTSSRVPSRQTPCQLRSRLHHHELEIPMKHLSVAALGTALILLSGCVAYPLDNYPARGDRGGGHDRGQNRDGNRDRDCGRDRSDCRGGAGRDRRDLRSQYSPVKDRTTSDPGLQAALTREARIPLRSQRSTA